MCLNCVCLHFRRNLRVLMKKRTSNVRSRKIRGSRTSRASKNSKTAKNRTRTGVPQGCTAVHPGQKAPKRTNPRTAGRAWTHGQPCAPRTAVRGVHARPCVWWHGRAVSGTAVPDAQRARLRFFSAFLCSFCFIFWVSRLYLSSTF